MLVKLILIVLMSLSITIVYLAIELNVYIINFDRILNYNNKDDDKKEKIKHLKFIRKHVMKIDSIQIFFKYLFGILTIYLFNITFRITFKLYYIIILYFTIYLVFDIFLKIFINKRFLKKKNVKMENIIFLEKIFLIKNIEDGKKIEEDTEFNIRNMLEIEDSKNEEEKKMIYGVFDIRETMVSEILTPRTSLYTIDGEHTIDEDFTESINQGFSRIPVYIENVDNIVGILFLKDMLKYSSEDRKNIKVKDVMRKAYYIPGTKKVTELLKEFKKTQNHIAIIIDEYGGTEGIVTIEDILEEIVGEIRDEYDVEEEKLLKIANNIYEVSGDNLIEEVNEKLNTNFEESEEYDTVSGYFLHKLGRMAIKGDVIKDGNCVLKVIAIDNVKIKKIKIILLDQ